jgi:hypothetical protein
LLCDLPTFDEKTGDVTAVIETPKNSPNTHYKSPAATMLTCTDRPEALKCFSEAFHTRPVPRDGRRL